MSQNIKSPYTKRQIINYRTGSEIRASDWQDLGDFENLGWARIVSNWGGAVFEGPFQPGTTSQSTTNSNGNLDLDELNLGGIVTREIDGGVVRVSVKTYAEDTTFEATITNESSGIELVSAQSWTITTAANDEQTFDLDIDDVFDGSENPQKLSLELTAADRDGSNASDVYAISVDEAQISSTSDIKTSSGTARRYKGLTTDQQAQLLFCYRIDTLIGSANGYPAKQSEIAPPIDGTQCKYWADASDARAYLADLADTLTYQSSTPRGLEFEKSNNEALIAIEDVSGGLSNTNRDYFGQLIHSTLTFVARCNLTTVTNSTKHCIFAAGRRADANCWYLGYEVNGSGGVELRALCRSSSSDVYDSSTTNIDSERNANVLDEIVVEQDTSAGTVSVSVNGTEVFSDTGLSYPSGPITPTNPVGMGGAIQFSGANEDYADITVQGVAADTQTGVGTELGDLIAGDDYSG